MPLRLHLRLSWPMVGGDNSSVRDRLKNARDIQGSAGAFAAILEDDSVTTWGDPERGGDSSAVQDQFTTL